MSNFLVQDDAVWLTGACKPWRMSDGFVDQWLDKLQFDAERGDDAARTLFNSLYAAQRAAMGELHIPRVSPFRQRPTLVWSMEDALYAKQLEAIP